MSQTPPFVPAGDGTSALGRAKDLAERMAKVLNHEDVADVSLAVALLTSGVVHQYAEDLTAADDLITGIRRLKDRLIESAFAGKAKPVH